MEGEAKEALAAIPGLARKRKMAPFVLVISDNNTKLSGRIDEQSFSMAPTFDSLSALGWEVIQLNQAHDLSSCVLAVERAFERVLVDCTQPICIHAKTIKGYGVKQTVESPSGGHGFPLKDAGKLREFLEEIYQGHPPLKSL